MHSNRTGTGNKSLEWCEIVGVKWRKPVPTYAIDVHFSGIGGLGEFGEFGEYFSYMD